jgi:hypothetical protein
MRDKISGLKQILLHCRFEANHPILNSQFSCSAKIVLCGVYLFAAILVMEVAEQL